MGNLLNEYRKRHKLDFVWSSCANGVCFFSKGGKPSLICLTSEPMRSLSTCPKCKNHKEGDIVVELVSFPGNKELSLVHDHIHPDTDLNVLVKKNIGEELNPFQAKTYKDLEVWLWSFFLQLRPIQGTHWQRFRKMQKGSKCSQVVEQMFWAACHSPAIYRFYYHSFYSVYLLGRNYLMYR